MVQVTDGVLQDMVAAIVAEVAPARVYLFGSRARRGAAPDADIDFVVVENRLSGTRREELSRIRRAISFVRHPKDILVFTQDEFDRFSDAVNHVAYQCVKEGRLLYART